MLDRVTLKLLSAQLWTLALPVLAILLYEEIRQLGIAGLLVPASSNLDKEEIEMAHVDTKVLTAHVPLPLVEKVDQLAARLERSRGWIIKQALSAWIDQEEERSRLTREALADVDAGCVINHQAVQAWADSLSTDTPLPMPR